jgi:hypothetical protein
VLLLSREDPVTDIREDYAQLQSSLVIRGFLIIKIDYQINQLIVSRNLIKR